MEFLTRPITSERLEEKGQSLYKLGKLFMFFGTIGFALLLLSVLIALAMGGTWLVSKLFTFSFYGDYALLYYIIPVGYIGILLGILGVPMYLNGLNVFALGRIAHNTEKE